MASLQCSKPSEQQKHDQQDHHYFGHMSDKIKGVFKGHNHIHGQAPTAAHQSANASSYCKPVAKKREQHKNKDGGLLHKIKDAFSDHSSDSSSDSDNEGHKAHHKRKNWKEKEGD